MRKRVIAVALALSGSLGVALYVALGMALGVTSYWWGTEPPPGPTAAPDAAETRPR